MGKITKALQKLQEDRYIQSSSENLQWSENISSKRKGGVVKNGWLFWVFIIGVVVTVFISFNYEGNKTVVPLSEIFPEDQELAQVEYEYVDKDVEKPAATVQQKQTSAKSTTTAKAPVIAKTDTKTETRSVSAVETAKKENTKLTFTTSTATSSPLDSLKSAVADVPEVIAKAADNVATAANPPKPQAGDFSIQVASFKQEQSAQQELEKLLKKEFPAFVESRDLADKGTWYRVYVGRFESKQKAGEYLKNVQASYKDSFIIKLK